MNEVWFGCVWFPHMGQMTMVWPLTASIGRAQMTVSQVVSNSRHMVWAWILSMIWAWKVSRLGRVAGD